MHNEYMGVNTRFLDKHERLMLSDENELPLVIEPNGKTDVQFLQSFLSSHSDKIKADIAKYGAVLLRGFNITSEEEFENTVLTIQGFKGISEAFMSEQGRTHVGKLKYVLHTNSVYKTGGTLYLGGFHSENYYSTDAPTYICFCCLKPSTIGGETGLVNVEKVYANLSDDLKNKLEKQTYFVAKWLVSEVAERYQITPEVIEEICQHFDLPIVGIDKEKFILMYKPAVYEHPITKKKALGINLFELPTLNYEIRKHFMNDYQGKTWFWHRLIWKLPTSAFKILESTSMIFISLFHSPQESFEILCNKLKTYKASLSKKDLPAFNQTKVGSCFNADEVKMLAKLIRKNYSSCLWQRGDILLVDNRKVMHAGMPGAGPRCVRAIICNPIEMRYSLLTPGCLPCRERNTETVGYYMAAGKLDTLVSQAETVSTS